MKEVLSICEGVVVAVGRDPTTKLIAVVVQYDGSTVLRYSNLTDALTVLGQLVFEGTKIGSCADNMKIQLGTTAHRQTYNIIFYNGQTYYEDTPSDLLINYRNYLPSVVKEPEGI